jgi:hypothetical protein
MGQPQMRNDRLRFLPMIALACAASIEGAAAQQAMSCINAKPEGRLVQRWIVFENQQGVRSSDRYPLLKSFDPARNVVAIVNNSTPAEIKLSDWTALHIELRRPNPAAQQVPPTETNRVEMDKAVETNSVEIRDGMISIAGADGCAGQPIESGDEQVFEGAIQFENETHWHIVGTWVTFSPPSRVPFDGGTSRKPGG